MPVPEQREDPPKGSASPNVLHAADVLPTAAVVGIVLATTVATGIRHDHREYGAQWAAALEGVWHPTNAYGPLHNAFAPLFAIHPLLPKVAFAGLALLCAAVLHRKGMASGVVGTGRIVCLAFVLNPVVIVSTYVYGQNDIVAAALVLFALVARSSGRPLGAGVLLGLAALAKLYPLMLAPFLALEAGRVLRLRVIAGAVGTLAVGMASAVFLWGMDALDPITFGSGREAKMLSIFRFLTCYPDLVGGEEGLAMLLDSNTLVVLAVTGLTFGALYVLGSTWRAGSILGLLAVLVAYKVGHPQFYVTWLVVLTWLLLEDRKGQAGRVAVRVLPVAALVALFQVLYVTGAVTEGVRCWASVPFTLTALASLGLGLLAIDGITRRQR
ncbi:MAG: glycosyltransferase 87 family protein [Longimicrobiales bacterium]|nr:glycosyltransferase 87 family protein [Longimicrobiales bacterium]